MKRLLLKRTTTQDRGPPGGGATIHTVEQLGPNMRKLPNGSLLCMNVPLARTGWMMYGPNEIPITVGPQGLAYVERTEDDLFAEDTLGSCVGAAVVDEHPEDDVVPSNWNKLARGFSLEAWRGEGDQSDLILGNLLITDESLIDSVLSGKREISLGYEADYEQLAEGVGRQSGIIVNHIALVEKGRCGPRCAIGDHAHKLDEKETKMATKLKVTAGGGNPRRKLILDGLRAAVKDAEEELAGEPDGDEGATHIHIHAGGDKPDADTKDEGEAGEKEDPYEKRFAAIEGSLKSVGDALTGIQEMLNPKKETNDAAEDDPDMKDDTKDAAEEEDDEGKGKTNDSAALATSYASVLAKCEILVPGFRMPTFDAAKPRKVTVDSMCATRRKALDLTYATKDGAALIDGITGASTLDLDKMGCKDAAILFNAAAVAKAALNNANTKDSGKNVEPPKGVQSLAEINKANAAYWATRV